MPESWGGEGLLYGPFIIHPTSPPHYRGGWEWWKIFGDHMVVGGNGGGSLVANRVKGVTTEN